MLLLVVHLPAYRQIVRIRPDMLTEVQAALDRFVEDSGSEQLYAEEGRWIVHLKSFRGGIGKGLSRRRTGTARGLWRMWQRIDEFERQLQGYSILVDEWIDSTPASVLEEYHDRALLIPLDRYLWISKAAARLFEDVLTLEDGDMRKVVNADTGKGSEGPPVAEFCVRNPLLEKLLGVVQRIYLGESIERCIVIDYTPGDGAIETVRYLLEVVSESVADPFWMYTTSTADTAAKTPASVLGIESAREVFEPVEYLTETENSVWQSLSTVGKRRASSDRLGADFCQILTLYLSAYEKMLAEEFLPPIWVCQDINDQPSWVAEGTARFLHNLNDHSNVIPIMMVRTDGDSSFIGEVPHLRLCAGRMSFEEIEEKVQSSASGESDWEELLTFERSSPDVDPVTLLQRLELYITGDTGNALSSDPDKHLVDRMEPALRTLCSIRALLTPVLGRALLDQWLQTIGYDQGAILESAEAAGKMRDASPGDPIVLVGKLDDASQSENLAEFLVENRNTGNIEMSESLALLIWRGGRLPNTAKIIREYVIWLLDSDRVPEATALLNLLAGSEGGREARVILESLKLRVAVACTSEGDATKVLSWLKSQAMLADPELEGNRHLECTRYYYAAGAFSEGLQSAKDALMIFQQENPPKEAEACVFVALHMLAVSKLDEAEAYFGIARESAGLITPAMAVISGLYAAVTQFMVGDLTQALAIISDAEAIALNNGIRRYQIYLKFLAMRIQFELGRYELCIQLCLEGMCLGELYGKVALPAFRRWLRRSQVFGGYLTDGLAGLSDAVDDPEELLFLSEAYYIGHEYEKAAKLVGRAGNVMRDSVFSPAEQIDWSSGFAMLEDRAIPGVAGVSVLGMLIRSFSAYMCCFVGRAEQGITELARISREDRLAEIDPYNGIYHQQYAHAIGEVSGAGDLDRLTALSKALKYIQERAATIGDAGDKQSYLHQNYWNNLIIEEARNSKLI